MIKQSRSVIVFTIFVAAGLTWSHLAQSLPKEEEQEDWPGDAPEVALEINILQENTSITSDLTVVLNIENQTDKSFQVDKVELRIPGHMAAIRDYDKNFMCNMNRIENQGMAQCLKEIDAVDLLDDLISIESLFFTPGEYALMASVRYREAIEDKPFIVSRVQKSIHLRPSLSAILRGGVIGALLLSVLRVAYRLGTPSNQKKSLAILEGFTLFCLGSIVSIVVIVLLQRLVNLSLPISIKVEDALGGMVIGLFSAKLGNWLYGKLFIIERGGSGSGDGGASPATG